MDSNELSPFFSIITPVYNGEKYLEECIESVIKQTYSSWELILVNDGSTDKSGEICDRYSDDTRIKVIHQKNMGALCSRLNGIAKASGRYEIGLDADDYLDPDCLEKIKNTIDKCKSDLIFFGLRYVGEEEGDCKCSLEAGKEYSGKAILKEVVSKTNHSLCNKAIKLDIVKNADYEGINDRGRILNDDYALIVPIICNVNKGYVMDDVLYNYRIYGESSSHIMVTPKYILDTGFATEFALSKMEKAISMEADMYEAVYCAYIRMISARLLSLFAQKQITEEECECIHASDVYQKAGCYETVNSLGVIIYTFLKLFRLKQYGLLRIMTAVMKKVMHI